MDSQSLAWFYQQHPLWMLGFAGLLGLVTGSFLNVVIHRLPLMLQRQWQRECASAGTTDHAVTEPTFNLALPRSHCPKCQHLIRWYDNIPVVSWLVLRGRCRQCDTKISARYPLLEALTAAVFVAIAYHYPIYELTFYVYASAFSLLLCLFWIDVDEMLLPDTLNYLLLWLGLWFSTTELTALSPATAIIGAIVGYLSLWLVYWLFKLLTGKEGMGDGDFKLLAAIGAWIGWLGLPVVIVIAALSGAILGSLYQWRRPAARGLPIPFGPFLIIGGILGWAYGEQWLQSYWLWLGG